MHYSKQACKATCKLTKHHNHRNTLTINGSQTPGQTNKLASQRTTHKRQTHAALEAARSAKLACVLQDNGRDTWYDGRLDKCPPQADVVNRMMAQNLDRKVVKYRRTGHPFTLFN